MELTRDQAVKLAKTEFWKDLSSNEIVSFQLFEGKLCMPFEVFHEAIEKELARPVFTHEFADIERVRAEFLGDRPAPTIKEIIELIPEDKRVIIGF